MIIRSPCGAQPTRGGMLETTELADGASRRSCVDNFKAMFLEGGFTSDGDRSSVFCPCLGEVYLVSERFADQRPEFLIALEEDARTSDPSIRRRLLTAHWKSVVSAERLETERLAKLETERLEKEQLERERQETARLEKAHLEKERREKAEREKKRLAAEKRRQERVRQEQARKAAAKQAQTASLPIVQELDLLGRLLKSGHLSQAEYDRRKQAILDRRFGKVVTAAGGTGDDTIFAEGVTFGDYHALIIGINDYKHFRKLCNAENDARLIAGVLSKQYGFKTTLMPNPARAQIIDRLDLLREQLKFKDNLVIYYAGHDWLDQLTDQGYRVPVDARPNWGSNWISNAVATYSLRAIKAKHVMLLADSCFAGRLTRGIGVHLCFADY